MLTSSILIAYRRSVWCFAHKFAVYDLESGLIFRSAAGKMSVQIVDAFRGIEKRPSNFFRKEEKQEKEKRRRKISFFRFSFLVELSPRWVDQKAASDDLSISRGSWTPLSLWARCTNRANVTHCSPIGWNLPRNSQFNTGWTAQSVSSEPIRRVYQKIIIEIKIKVRIIIKEIKFN